LILPALALAKNGNGQGQKGDDHGHGGRIPSAPEVNTGIVLIPFVGAVLVFSAFQVLHAKAAQKKL
jgi:hypothetical protein